MPDEVDPTPKSLDRLGREGIKRAYVKCIERLPLDAPGALTSARTLLEEACHYSLDILSIPYSHADDLPKIFRRTAEALSIDPQSSTAQTNKKIAGAIHTLVQSVGELRNQAGDAHGSKLGSASLVSQATLAVELALSITDFLLSSVDGYIAATKRKTASGEAILKFDKSAVWRLVDHSQNAKKSIRSFGEKRAKRCLWLVGDSGIYLMSNGLPPMLEDGRVVTLAKANGKRRFVAYAEGCGPDDDLDHWWSVHGLVAEGSDFSLGIPLSFFRRALDLARTNIVVVGSENGVHILSDGEFAELP